jgi:predicted O-methyltransferase YrrM
MHMVERVAKQIETLEAFMAGVEDALALPRESAELVHALVLGTGAKQAVEIGTSYGYSGLWIAWALAQNGGRLITIDNDVRKSTAARTNFAKAGLGSYVDVRTGDAAEILPALDSPIDFVLNDADKENCRLYVELLVNKLADRAVVVTDNINTHAEELAGFMSWIRQHESFFSTPVAVGSGMELSVKRPSN